LFTEKKVEPDCQHIKFVVFRLPDYQKTLQLSKNPGLPIGGKYL